VKRQVNVEIYTTHKLTKKFYKLIRKGQDLIEKKGKRPEHLLYKEDI
jgi:hypothetical protein